ncbi:MAG: DUF4381 domain-containing protein [Xanthomonadales bacterium]|nr:DUF4381 domain-containing protein [Gammaproteobacteria bacterium]MBT8054216.1 DUF4381 domain-containing protein [Gammaproteobacteria bacterium]NND57591.1 DUF4381 domain-containing protein [Xanthomonadales bacterium]NNK51315.1 DUF4381 domain-containing protein [Xanthomonadales bacterium]
MNADSASLLDQLKDIHSAGQPGWWPPAPGWWLLVLLGLGILWVLLRRLIQRHSVRQRRKAWLHELEQLNREHDPQHSPHEFVAGLNRLFRAVALKAFPDTACARLQGEPWVAFIASLMPEGADNSSLGVLAHGPYEPLPRVDAASLNSSAKTWVNLYG